MQKNLISFVQNVATYLNKEKIGDPTILPKIVAMTDSGYLDRNPARLKKMVRVSYRIKPELALPYICEVLEYLEEDNES